MFRCFELDSNGFKDMYVHECGIHAFDNNYKHASDTKINYGGYLIHFVIKGSGKVRKMLGKKVVEERTVSKGQIFFIPPENEYDYSPDTDDPWDYFWVAIKGGQSRHYIESLGLFSEPVKNITNREKVEKAFIQLIEIVQIGKNREFNIFTANRMYALLVALSQGCKGDKVTKSAKDDLISKADTYISLHINKEITVEMIANKLNIDRSYLYILFMEKYGIPPSKYITNAKIEYSCTLLSDKTTVKSVKEVAHHIGYETSQHFSTIFKKTKGISPSQWKGKFV